MIVQARKTTMRQIFGTFLIFEFPNLFCTQGKELRRLVLTIYYSKVVGPKLLLFPVYFLNYLKLIVLQVGV